jgi:hypothetical protein
MKRFSRIKETDNQASKLRLCFDYEATEDPVTDLHAAGLLLAHDIWDVRSNHSHYGGQAYIFSDSREQLEEARAQLRKMGWEEMPE